MRFGRVFISWSLVALSLSVICATQELNDADLASPTQEEGRALFDWGIFRKISQFLGWGRNSKKATHRSGIQRRPEMLPYEVMNSENRRSSFAPMPQRSPDGYFVEPRPKKWYPKEQNSKPWLRRKAKRRPYFKKNTPSYISSHKRQGETFEPENLEGRAEFEPELRDMENTFTKIDRTGQNLQFVTAKVESRKPVVAVYGSGEKQVIPQTQNDKSTNNSIHSMFAIKKYAPKLDTRPVNPYIKESETYIDDGVDNIKIETANFIQTKPFKTQQKEEKFDHRLSVPTYPFVKPGPVQKPPPSSYFSSSPLVSTHYEKPFHSKPQEEKGFFDNVSSFASNLFGKLLPKPSFSANSTPLKRRHIQRAKPIPSVNLAHYSDVGSPRTSSDSKSEVKSSNSFFAPSPQQGLISKDVFQPIFKPSHSMDEKLPKDAMKPLIIPQKRTAQAAPELSQPELIDFF